MQASISHRILIYPPFARASAEARLLFFEALSLSRGGELPGRRELAFRAPSFSAAALDELLAAGVVMADGEDAIVIATNLVSIKQAAAHMRERRRRIAIAAEDAAEAAELPDEPIVAPKAPEPPAPAEPIETPAAKPARAKRKKMSPGSNIVIDAYNKHCAHVLPEVSFMTPAREKEVSRWLDLVTALRVQKSGKEPTAAQLEHFANWYFHRASLVKRWCRPSTGEGHIGWTADFSFLTKDKQFAAIVDMRDDMMDRELAMLHDRSIADKTRQTAIANAGSV